MGRLVERLLELEPKINEIYRMASVVNTYRDNDRALERAYRCFQSLIPLSRKARVVGQAEPGMIVVGKWIRVRRHGGSDREVPPSVFMELVCKHDEAIAEHVSKLKRELFLGLVALAKELLPYDIVVEIDVPDVEIDVVRLHDYPIRVVKKRVRKLSLWTLAPDRVVVHDPDTSYLNEYFYIDNLGSIASLENVIDYVVELYRKAEREVARVREHNEAIIAKMEELAFHAPRK